ncbi:tumor necrosis factor receptor superfamily member 14-like isoform X2 [Acanthochromis polyacanthus]|uniref:tumor necrosis factor receptor superfamily member 14-like isoform X2 n=1 Tax=Acanthochromis polyacanthus TaxID=80966 RepID=UPI0022347051|nr:tumor necrosis factor receptor superfamily member 14-like isoform X2 [Acanthochromis polyacanthus]
MMFCFIDEVFLQLQLNKSQFSVRWCLQIKKNYNFPPHKMIWRRKLLTPATFLIIVMKVFTGHALTCHPGEYQIGNKCCPMCPAGSRVKTDCTEFRPTTCLPCLDGTYVDKPTGQKKCFDCANYDKGLGLKVKTSCTTTSNTVCEPLEGFYCTDRIGNNCVAAQKHTICQPGQYINQAGTPFTDTVCSDCSAGTFSDGTFTSYQPHSQCESVNLQVIKPGTSTDAECGEKSSNVAVAVIIPFVLLFLLIPAGLIYWFYFRKKKMSFREEKKHKFSHSLSTFVRKWIRTGPCRDLWRGRCSKFKGGHMEHEFETP